MYWVGGGPTSKEFSKVKHANTGMRRLSYLLMRHVLMKILMLAVNLNVTVRS